MSAACCGRLIHLSGTASDCSITHNMAKEWSSIYEINSLVDRSSGLLPIEAKSGRNVASDWLDGLKNWRVFARDRVKHAVLIYGGLVYPLFL